MKTVATFVLLCAALSAQEPNPTQNLPAQPGAGEPVAIFRVTVVSRNITAINYHHRTGSTNVDLHGTELMPEAKGEARVDSKQGATKITVNTQKMLTPSRFGPEYLTYVMWAITPEGRANNIGELVLDGDHTHLEATSDLQAFGLIVTAEPYFAVTQPSDVVVMENFVRKDTTGTFETMDAKYELLQRGQYTLHEAPEKVRPLARNLRVPLQLQEARNAIQIVKWMGADQYAADTMQKAAIDMQNAEGFFASKQDKKQLDTNAREATQMAEDARIITLRKQREEQLAKERADSAAREADANAKAQEEARQRAQADQARAHADAARAQSDAAAAASAAESARLEQQRQAAEQARQQAEAAAQESARQKAEADAARLAAQQQQQAAQAETEQARLAAQQADAARQAAIADKEQMRQRLLQQLNLILETRDTARGLIVNMSDVLFDFNKSTLRPAAREKLSKVSGIILAYPGLRMQVEGHTDAIGSEEYNMKLSQRRADTVRDYLTSQGVAAGSITSQGLGKADPVASNSTAAGRQQNRRVEMVVSGEVIGTQLSPSATAPAAAQPPQ